jgi:hypothetical protein
MKGSTSAPSSATLQLEALDLGKPHNGGALRL